LIQNGLAADIGGHVDLDFRAAGVVCTIQTQLRGVREVPIFMKEVAAGT
jgi:hypothetical protein